MGESNLMTKRELVQLDKLLVKLQQHRDCFMVLDPQEETLIKARKVVDIEITRMEKRSHA